MMSLYTIRNIFALACFIVLVYILYAFLSGSLIRESLNLYGTWEAIEIYDVITFTEKNCIRGDKIEEYKIRENRIILSSGEEYEITLTKYHLQLNGILYLKR